MISPSIPKKQAVGDGIVAALGGIVGKNSLCECHRPGTPSKLSRQSNRPPLMKGVCSNSLSKLSGSSITFLYRYTEGLRWSARFLFAEMALFNLGVQSGEKQVLQHSAVVGVAGFVVVIFLAGHETLCSMNRSSAISPFSFINQTNSRRVMRRMTCSSDDMVCA